MLLTLAGVLFYISMGEMIGMPLPDALDPHHHPILFGIAQLLLVVPVLLPKFPQKVRKFLTVRKLEMLIGAMLWAGKHI